MVRVTLDQIRDKEPTEIPVLNNDKVQIGDLTILVRPTTMKDRTEVGKLIRESFADYPEGEQTEIEALMIGRRMILDPPINDDDIMDSDLTLIGCMVRSAVEHFGQARKVELKKSPTPPISESTS